MANASFNAAGIEPAGGGTTARRALGVACVAHALHDGYTDLIYVLLPVWQAEFGLDYAVLAALRGAYAGTMAGLQIPSGWLAGWLGARTLLALGTALAALGYALAGLSGGLIGLFAALAISGAGSSTQHPLASAVVTRAYGNRARGPLGTYNFAGDPGKASLPAATSLLLTLLPWRGALGVLAAARPDRGGRDPGIPATPGRFRACRATSHRGQRERRVCAAVHDRRAGQCRADGAADLLLPFLLKGKGASLPLVGLALSLVFIGGALGKFACAYLGARLGVLWTVMATEGATAILIGAVVVLPLVPVFVALPFLGVVLNGTSSVLYGTVPELASAHHAERSFAVFYTGTIGSGAVAPVLFGALGNVVGASWASMATAATALVTLPLAACWRPGWSGDGAAVSTPFPAET